MQKTQTILTQSVLGFGIILLLTACSREQKQELVITTVPATRPAIIVPEISKVTARKISWIIITEDNVDNKLQELRDKNQPVVLFALTADGYENLSLNINDIRSLVEQQKQVIISYETYYAESENG